MIDLNEAPAKDRWIGRLDSHLDGFEALLDGQGYAKTTVRQKIKLLAGFSAWVERRDVPLSLLREVEVAALLAAPDLGSWGGRRDRALLLLAVQTGLRAAEIIGLRCEDIVLGPAAYVQCQGKGRKLRNTPLRKDTVTVLRAWLAERRGRSADPAFPTINGTPLSHDALQYLLNKHLAVARRHCPSLTSKHVTPHVLRHTLAMDLLHHGVDRSVIALWLGHESVETTAIYLQADMTLKEKALAKTDAADVRSRRYKPNDHLLAFLKSL